MVRQAIQGPDRDVLPAGVVALVLASLGAFLSGSDNELWIGAAISMFTSLLTIARAGTYHMSHA